ncbi:phage distal tail protein [Methanococcus maripaludis]|uniref:Phage-related protein n=1 Tax=Methanococcus maripaludis TaxID=39152 RepID=A0A7J9S0G3_METMI|nr:phage tail domain-containing protein [Methanococcus maripaludis]MBB6067865.1 phage-related protein [Methanococcus maripaludis]
MWNFTNGKGESVDLSSEKPIMLQQIEGLNSPKIKYTTTQGYGQTAKVTAESVEPLTITIRGIINIEGLDEEIKTYTSIISSVFSPKKGVGTLKYTASNGDVYENKCYVVQPKIFPEAEKRTFFTREFSIQLLCPSPYWSLTPAVEEYLGFAVGGLEFPFELDVEFEERRTKATINNPGDVDSPLLISFYGPATLPEIKNNTTSEVLKLEKSLLSNEVLEISTDNDDITAVIRDLETGTESDAFNYIDIASMDFFKLYIGDNELEFSTGDSTEDAYVTLEYTTKFIMVEE